MDLFVLKHGEAAGGSYVHLTLVQAMSKRIPRSHRTAGVIALIAGLILIVSGVTSGSLLLKALGYVDNYLGTSVPQGQLVVQIAILLITYVVGLGGIAVIIGGALLFTKHGTAGRFLIGLGGGTAIFGLLFSMAEAIYVTGFSAPIFHQAYFVTYWFGAILATASIFISRRDPATKPIV